MRLVCGVGVNNLPYGFSNRSNLNRKAYSTWYNLLKRCYVKNDKCYKYYGAKGVYVCEDWLIFSNFYLWFIENYVEGYDIDKDKKGILDKQGNKYYSPESCVFIPKKENLTYRTPYKKGIKYIWDK